MCFWVPTPAKSLVRKSALPVSSLESKKALFPCRFINRIRWIYFLGWDALRCKFFKTFSGSVHTCCPNLSALKIPELTELIEVSLALALAR